MKHIRKKNEPETLRVYRETTDGASYDGLPGDTKRELKLALLEEQGFLCAYCMKPLAPKSKNVEGDVLSGVFDKEITIEHIYPRALCQTQMQHRQLDYKNLVAVCDGNSEGEFHCDKTQGPQGKASGQVSLACLDPTDAKMSENLLTYLLDGTICAKSGRHESCANHDLNTVLNLNHPVLQRNRKAVFDVVKTSLEGEMPKGTWNQQLFDRQIERWKNLTSDKYGVRRYKPYCMAALDFLEKLKNSPKYQ